MKYLRVVALFSSALWLASCAEPKLESICEENGSTRPCTAKEQAMIDDMHYIIRAIRNFEQSQPDEINWVERFNSTRPKVFFYGETHTEIIGQIQTLAAVNAIAKPRDVYLREGSDRTYPYKANCGLELILDIFKLWQWEKLGIRYDPFKSYQWRVSQRYDEMFEATKRSYDLTGLSIAFMTCGYWDSGQALNECMKNPDLIPKLLKVRNISMTHAIEEGLDKYNRVIVNAGYNHLPIGEIITLSSYNRSRTDLPNTLDDFYRLVNGEKKKPKASRSLIVPRGAGSTKVIDDFLKEKNLPFLERVHGKMFANDR